jgi:dienelactone hydrolase
LRRLPRQSWLAIVAALLCLAAPAAQADHTVGIVLMHGMQGSPYRIVDGLAAALTEAGYLLERPEMCWSKSRIYDRAYEDCLREVDDAVAKLRADGATAIIVAGMSLGGNAALAYGASRNGLQGVIALAPAHDPEVVGQLPWPSAAVAKAQAMIADGHGDERTVFADVNGGPTAVEATPQIYLSFVGSQSPGKIPVNTAHLKAPLLWVAGTRDPTQNGGPDYAFAKAPPNPMNRYVTVSSDHLGTPDAARAAVLAWLRDLLGG